MQAYHQQFSAGPSYPLRPYNLQSRANRWGRAIRRLIDNVCKFFIHMFVSAAMTGFILASLPVLVCFAKPPAVKTPITERCAKNAAQLLTIPELEAMVLNLKADHTGSIDDLFGLWKTIADWGTPVSANFMSEPNFSGVVTIGNGKPEKPANMSVCLNNLGAVTLRDSTSRKAIAAIRLPEATDLKTMNAKGQSVIWLAEVNNRTGQPKTFYRFTKEMTMVPTYDSRVAVRGGPLDRAPATAPPALPAVPSINTN